MRGPGSALLMVGLALCAGPTFSQSSQASQASRGVRTAEAAAAPHARYSADELYNLGNSYARAGKAGLAVLNYERAALLAPQDADIRANLEYVRAAAHVSAQPRSLLARVAEAASPATAAWLGVFGLALAGVGMVAGKMTSGFRLLRTCSIVAGSALVALTVSNAMLQWPRMHEAVILVNQTQARVTPVPMGDTAFVLPEAETVTLTAEHEDFVLVRTRDGRSGWVARANVGAVVPLRER